MTEPITTLATPAVTAGAFVVFGAAMGIRPELLIAGFWGSFGAMALLNTVPSSGDTWQHMLKTSWRRVGVAVASAFCSAYCAPLVPLIPAASDPHLLGAAFVVGAGAQPILAYLIQRATGKKSEASE